MTEKSATEMNEPHFRLRSKVVSVAFTVVLHSNGEKMLFGPNENSFAVPQVTTGEKSPHSHKTSQASRSWNTYMLFPNSVVVMQRK